MEQQFIARATEVGATLHPAEGREEAMAMVADLFRSVGGRLAVVSPDLGDLWAGVAESLAAAGARFVAGEDRYAVGEADFGVTRAALAIAETGSVVVAGNDLLPRMATMLPLVHVILVDSQRLVPSLDEAGEFLRRSAAGETGEPVRYVSFVSGPSRTADVEKTLSVGVHGPRELHIVLVRA